jgi:thiosulfate/3-mercaptopyruvate sulfurtransferase
MSRLKAAAELLQGDWLRYRFVDASWMLGKKGAGKDAFAKAHIPGAVHFPIDTVCDRTTDLPHMLPPQAAFIDWASVAGLERDTPVVVYDTEGVRSAPRVVWTFELFGMTDVSLLNGGLPAWQAAGGPVTDDLTSFERTAFEPVFDEQRRVTHEEMKAIVHERRAQIVDVRPGPRFEGTAPEPRPGLTSGHMPGAINLPASEVLLKGALRPPAELEKLFRQKGLHKERPIVTTCGSGVAAALVELALREAGYTELRLYDGSWTQWASDPDAPIEGAQDV